MGFTYIESNYMEHKSISILGATGSIGLNTLDLIRKHPEKYTVKVLTAGKNIEKLIALTKEFKPKIIASANQSDFKILKKECPETQIMSVKDAAAVEADWTMAAIVGTAGLVPTMNAIERGKEVAFASKECLVAAGSLMMMAVKNCNATLLPVDSEHNAIFQVFDTKHKEGIKRLILTASGGPFRDWCLEDMEKATPKQAIAHPTWTMGAKISVDSASLMNKALEIIEAHYLFDIPSNQIDVIMHPQSLVHSMVEYVDGSILSQMGPSDMRTPIAYCLGWPERIQTSGPTLDFDQFNTMTFADPDIEKFKSLKFVRNVLDEGQAASIIFNASNEIANKAFLDKKIGFLDIYNIIEFALSNIDRYAINNIEDVIALDHDTRHITLNYISNRSTKVNYA